MSLITTSQSEIFYGAAVDGEVALSGSVLRGHVSNSGAISEAKVSDSRTEELNEFAYDATLSEHLDAG